MNEKLDYWLYQPNKFRYSTILIMGLIISYAIYLIGIRPIYDQQEQQNLQYQTLKQDITHLQQEITQFPAFSILNQENEQLFSQLQKLTFMLKQQNHIFMQLLAQSHLKLMEFTNKNDTDVIHYHVKVSGYFHDLLIFLESLSQRSIFLQLETIGIERQNDNLLVSLSFLSKYHQVSYE